MNTHAKISWTGLILLLAFAVSFSGRARAAQSAEESGTNTNIAVVVTNDPACLEVDDSGLWYPVEDLELTFDIGKQLLLMQQNSDYFIAIAPGEEGYTRLCAFPRLHARDQGTAWVTNEKYLFFGVRTRSCEGRFYFTRGEKLTIVYETNHVYRVAVQRYGRVVELELPKSIEGFTFVPAVQHVPEVLAQERHKPEVKPAPPRPVVDAAAQAPVMPRLPTAPNDDATSLEMPPGTETIPPSPPAMSTAAETQAMNISQLESPLAVSTSEVQVAAAPPATTKDKISAAVYRNIWALELLLALAILAAIPIIIRRNAATLKLNRPAQPPAFEPSTAQVAIVEAQIDKKANDEFAGSLDTFSMGDLIQFVHSTTKTGSLEIQHDAPAPSRLVFELGEIIDAQTADKRGEDAVYAICRIKKGSYTFSKESRTDVTKTVNKPTMSLLLDAHRIMDEENSAESPAAAKPPPPPPSLSDAPVTQSGKKKRGSRLTMK